MSTRRRRRTIRIIILRTIPSELNRKKSKRGLFSTVGPCFPGWSIMLMKRMKSRSAPALSRKMFLHSDRLRELLPRSGMRFRSRRAANWVGFLSILPAITPVAYAVHVDRFPDHAFTESVVLIGGVGGSLAAALLAGLMGCRWWLLASLAGAFDWLWLVHSVHSFSVSVRP